jgi:hypothetical protein
MAALALVMGIFSIGLGLGLGSDLGSGPGFGSGSNSGPSPVLQSSELWSVDLPPGCLRGGRIAFVATRIEATTHKTAQFSARVECVPVHCPADSWRDDRGQCRKLAAAATAAAATAAVTAPPLGWRLADVDECGGQKEGVAAVCREDAAPFCINTEGSFICVPGCRNNEAPFQGLEDVFGNEQEPSRAVRHGSCPCSRARRESPGLCYEAWCDVERARADGRECYWRP